MTSLRVVAPASFLLVALLAACSPAASTEAPASADASTPASAAPSESGSAAPSPSADTSAEPSGGGDPASSIPAAVGDVELSATVADADSYIVANVNRRLSPILTALGKTPADVTVATATGSTAGGATLFIDAVQIAGADAEGLLAAFQTAAEAVPGAQVETADVGGKPVVKMTTSSYTLAVYASGDTLIYVQSPDAALVDQAVAALS